MTFRPKRDRWLSGLMWGTIGLLAFGGLAPLLKTEPHLVEVVIAWLVCWGFAACTAWIWLGLRYTFAADELIIRVGPIVTKVRYDQIQTVRPIRSYLSSAAAATERLEIRYGRYDMVHVSPLDREGFLRELEARCPVIRTQP